MRMSFRGTISLDIPFRPPGLSAHTIEPPDSFIAYMLIASTVDPGSHTLTTEMFPRRLNVNTLVTSATNLWKHSGVDFQTRPDLPWP